MSKNKQTTELDIRNKELQLKVFDLEGKVRNLITAINFECVPISLGDIEQEDMQKRAYILLEVAKENWIDNFYE